MSDWNDPKARARASFAFCQRLQVDPELRRACTDDSDVSKASGIARRVLREAGEFENMPDDVEVRVVENDRAKADKIVTIVLPAPEETVDPLTTNSKDIWRCSWSLWEE